MAGFPQVKRELIGMGFLDSATDLVNKGVASTGRATKTLQLKAQLNDFTRKRDDLIAQLGASLYEETRIDQRFRAPREALFAEIEGVDARREELKAEIAQIENEAKSVSQTNKTIICPNCGKTILATDAFCTGCGTSITAIRASLSLCAHCGTPIAPDAKFCTVCGAPAAVSPAPVSAPEPRHPYAPAPYPVPTVVSAPYPVPPTPGDVPLPPSL
jgi:RNA polymerase subunit RPABC4/transcription elongation factor Spt4